MTANDLIIEKKGSILHLILNRPERLNAFSSEMISGILNGLKEARGDEDIRVIVLSGAGRSFCAGGDVTTMGQAGAIQVYEHIGRLNECILSMKATEIPIIAAVHGFASGAGFNLALACDLIIAAEDSKFAMSFSQVGLISDGGGSYFLPRLIGSHLAKEFFFSGKPVTARRLYELGVINQLVPSESLINETMTLATSIANGPGKALGMMKKIIDHSFTASLDEILEQERITQTMLVTTADHQEGVAAFKEKRKPVFKSK